MDDVKGCSKWGLGQFYLLVLGFCCFLIFGFQSKLKNRKKGGKSMTLYVVFLDEFHTNWAKEVGKVGYKALGYVIAKDNEEAKKMKELLKELKYWYPHYKYIRITSNLPKDGEIKHYEFLEKKLKAILEILEGSK